jgi:hypothetical protein
MVTLKRKRNNNNIVNAEYGYNKNYYPFPHNAPLLKLNEIPEYKRSLRNKNRRQKGKITGYFPRVSKRTRRNKSINAPMKEVPRIGRRFALIEEEDPSNNNIPRITATRANNNNNNS